MRIQVAPADAGQRLDLFLHRHCPGLSRNRIQKLIKEGRVRLDGRVERPSYCVGAGDCICLELPAPESRAVQPEKIPLAIVFEDGDLLVVDKAAGMSAHPAPGSWTGTLVNALLHHCRELSGINGPLRPGIVHRLDKDTTGLMVVAKNDAAHRHLAAQLERRRIERRYTALVWGCCKNQEERIEAPIARHPADRRRMAVVEGGRPALTHCEVVERFSFLSLMHLRLESGRTHQIRVHLHHRGHPVFGDPVYGGRNRVGGIRPEYRRRARALLELIERQALHAHCLCFAHPRSGQWLQFSAGLPADFARLLAAAREERAASSG